MAVRPAVRLRPVRAWRGSALASAGVVVAGAGAAVSEAAGIAGATGVVTAAGAVSLAGAASVAGVLVEGPALLSCAAGSVAGAVASAGVATLGAPSVRAPGIDDVTIGSVAGVAAVAGCGVAAGADCEASCARAGSDAARASVETRHRAARRMAEGLSSGSGIGTGICRYAVRIGICCNCLREDDCFAPSSQAKRIVSSRMRHMFGRFAAIGCDTFPFRDQRDAAATDDQRWRRAGVFRFRADRCLKFPLHSPIDR